MDVAFAVLPDPYPHSRADSFVFKPLPTLELAILLGDWENRLQGGLHAFLTIDSQEQLDWNTHATFVETILRVHSFR
jgi:hypothetical protein